MEAMEELTASLTASAVETAARLRAEAVEEATRTVVRAAPWAVWITGSVMAVYISGAK
jgi:hypothetical protein